MQTIQNTLSSLLLEAYNTMPVSTDRLASISGRMAAKNSSKFFANWWHRSLARRKKDSIIAFHVFANLHLLAILTLAMYFTIPDGYQLTFRFVSLSAGWFSFLQSIGAPRFCKNV